MSFINNTSADHSAFYCNKLCHNSHFRYGIVINNPYGGIGIAESKNVFFQNYNFTGNRNGKDGGGLRILQSSLNITIYNCLFENN